jgi:multidrug transporter EmrE-like cation transporter
MIVLQNDRINPRINTFGYIMTLVMAIAAALAYTIGGIFMKLSISFTTLIPSLLVYLCFAIGASLQTLVTGQSQLGVSYVLILGLESILAVIFGMVFFKESYSWQALCGLFLVVAGVAILRSVATQPS